MGELSVTDDTLFCTCWCCHPRRDTVMFLASVHLQHDNLTSVTLWVPVAIQVTMLRRSCDIETTGRIFVYQSHWVKFKVTLAKTACWLEGNVLTAVNFGFYCWKFIWIYETVTWCTHVSLCIVSYELNELIDVAYVCMYWGHLCVLPLDVYFSSVTHP